ncbi:MAG: hypothetical protein IT266_05195 [Saprospiraceae bacterium]|nr:hypothetical protein [Saprospiraceae bacterium]
MSFDPYEHVEDYINNSLSSDDRQRFEAALESDPGLELALKNFSPAKKFAASLIELETRQQLRAARPGPSWWKWLVAVAAMFVLALGYFALRPRKAATPEQVFAALYIPPASVAMRSGNEPANVLDSAIHLFDAGQYANSELLVRRILASDPSEVRALRYLGHLALQKKDYTLATTAFQQVFAHHQEPLASEANYLLCMIDIIRGDREQARDRHRYLVNSAHQPGKDKMALLANYLR